jgi:hypothetical protein
MFGFEAEAAAAAANIAAMKTVSHRVEPGAD